MKGLSSRPGTAGLGQERVYGGVVAALPCGGRHVCLREVSV